MTEKEAFLFEEIAIPKKCEYNRTCCREGGIYCRYFVETTFTNEGRDAVCCSKPHNSTRFITDEE